MNLPLKIALRFLKEGKGQTVFILLGISIGVAIQIFLNTLITGLQLDIINSTVGSSSHITLTGKSTFKDLDGAPLSRWEDLMDILADFQELTALSPSVDGNGFIVTTNEDIPVVIRGLDLKAADAIYKLNQNLIAGKTTLEGTQILIGTGLSSNYDYTIGDVIPITLPSGVSQNFSVAGIFDLGTGMSNDSWIILNLSQAQKFLGFGSAISKIELQIKEVFDAEIIDTKISSRLSDVEVANWIQSNASLLSALTSQSASSYMIQAFVLLAVTLGISSVLAISVVQKSKQLGILKAMGTKNRQISQIFLLQGLLLGIIGSIIGALMGIGLIESFLWGTALKTGKPLFPLVIEPIPIIAIMIIATLACTIAALIPARRSSKLNAVEVIRNG